MEIVKPGQLWKMPHPGGLVFLILQHHSNQMWRVLMWDGSDQAIEINWDIGWWRRHRGLQLVTEQV